MHISKISVTLLLLVTFLFPTSAHAFLGFGLGGRVLNTTACAIPTGAFFIEILTPNRGVQGYLWTPTIPYLHQVVPTRGQKVILLAGATPIPCTGVGLLGPKVGAGFPILFLLHGSSLR